MKMCLWYCRTKNAFLGYKNKKFKKSKNWDFCKGINPWFGSKIGHFSSFFYFFYFRQYRPGKVVLWYCRTKKIAIFPLFSILSNIGQERVWYSYTYKTHIPSVMCHPTWETHIPSVMCSPTCETHIPSVMCHPTWETHIPSVMCSPTCETHIPSVMCSPLLGNTYP